MGTESNNLTKQLPTPLQADIGFTQSGPFRSAQSFSSNALATLTAVKASITTPSHIQRAAARVLIVLVVAEVVNGELLRLPRALAPDIPFDRGESRGMVPADISQQRSAVGLKQNFSRHAQRLSIKVW